MCAVFDSTQGEAIWLWRFTSSELTVQWSILELRYISTDYYYLFIIITYAPYGYHMHTTWLSITCTPHGYYKHSTWVLHAQHMGITSAPYRYHMNTTWAPHAYRTWITHTHFKGITHFTQSYPRKISPLFFDVTLCRITKQIWIAQNFCKAYNLREWCVLFLLLLYPCDLLFLQPVGTKWPRKFKGRICCGGHLAVTYGGELLYHRIFSPSKFVKLELPFPSDLNHARVQVIALNHNNKRRSRQIMAPNPKVQ